MIDYLENINEDWDRKRGLEKSSVKEKPKMKKVFIPLPLGVLRRLLGLTKAEVQIHSHVRTRRGKLERVKQYVREYHGTTYQMALGIEQVGLEPQEYHNWEPEYFEHPTRKNKVFVTSEFDIAKKFAKSAMEHLRGPGGLEPTDPEEAELMKPVIVECEIPIEYWGANRHLDWKVEETDKKGRVASFMLPEVRPEWIKRILDLNGQEIKENAKS